ncbi:MAG: HlyD family efflux transporter periplasmic adaptor subunit, partial [Bacteroidota bacterium]
VDKVAAMLPTYPTKTVQLRDIEQPIRFTGRVIPVQETQIFSQVPGQVLPSEKILQEGKYYRRGELMLAIDRERLDYQLQAQRSQLITALVRIMSDLSIDYPKEHPIWEKFVKSIQPGNRLPVFPSIDNEQLRYFINANEIPSLYYQIKAQEATLDDYLIKAPFSGKLTGANVDPGSVVQPGQLLATLSRTDIFEVRAAVPVASASSLKVGQRIELFSRNLERSYQGTVNRLGASIDPNTQSVTAFIRVSGPDLRTGLYLEAELAGQSLEQVAILPKEAMSRDNHVYVISDGVVKSKPVNPLVIDSDKAYVAGLNSGDRVITQSIASSIIGTRAK